MNAVFVTVLFILVRLFPPAQISATAADNAKSHALIERLQKGDDASATEEAGRTNNRVFIPYLRERLRHDTSKEYSLKAEAQEALAKLGEVDQMQAIYCQVASGNLTQVQQAVGQLGYVGGWFSIRILDGVILGELAKNPKPDTSTKGDPGDALELEPKDKATYSLRAILSVNLREDMPMQERISFWREYIHVHGPEPNQLQPTGEGADFSEKACKNGKPVKRH